MIKLIRTSVNSIDYGSVEYGNQSAVYKFDIFLDDETDTSVTITSIDFPEHVMGKLSTDSEYSEEITGTFIIPYKIFENETKYFMDINGATTEDETKTGIYLGEGQNDKRLLVDIQICLQDELGYILEDENGNFLEDI